MASVKHHSVGFRFFLRVTLGRGEHKRRLSRRTPNTDRLRGAENAATIHRFPGAQAMLIVFAGLPGTGKSTIARELARELDAVWLRIDSIEQAIRESCVLSGGVDGAGYAVAYRLAEDNLLLGRTVVGDSVNPWTLTRDAWRSVGRRAGVHILEVETICSDLEEHHRRVETRTTLVPGLRPPNWAEVIERDYHPWNRSRLIIDTAQENVKACVGQIRQVLSALSE